MLTSHYVMKKKKRLCHNQINYIKFCHKVWSSRVLLKDEKMERIKQMIDMCLTSNNFIFVEGHPIIMLTLP